MVPKPPKPLQGLKLIAWNCYATLCEQQCAFYPLIAVNRYEAKQKSHQAFLVANCAALARLGAAVAVLGRWLDQ